MLFLSTLTVVRGLQKKVTGVVHGSRLLARLVECFSPWILEKNQGQLSLLSPIHQ